MVTAKMSDAEKEAQQFQQTFARITEEVKKVIVGHDKVIEQVVTAIISGGHCLLEGVPGIGKTVLVKTLGGCLSLTYSRVQFTPDLMPADITGTNIIMEDEAGKKYFKFQKGPIFANMILADEINRATPKTQSALLECMQELGVTIAGNRYTIDEPFIVLATQNPIEMEGTFPLPEAQLDRFFFKISMLLPSREEMMQIIDRTTGNVAVVVQKACDGAALIQMRSTAREVVMASPLKDYVVRMVGATHPSSSAAPDMVRRYVKYGASPRGAQAITLASKVLALTRGRLNVSYDDIREVVYPSLRHRILLNFEGEAEGVKTDDIIAEIVKKVPELARQAGGTAVGGKS